MERRKITKKNGTKVKEFKSCIFATRNAIIKPKDPKFPVTIYFFNRPRLYRAFESLAKEREMPMRKIILSLASLGLKAYLKETGQAFKNESV